jgi:SAM-dependent methyltransferase
VLDAACGTGMYWPALLDAGCSVVGIDQSSAALRVAQKKFPTVLVQHLGLQEIAWELAFDAITCIDAMEFVFPEHWPLVLANFRRALKPSGLLYLTVELPEPDLPEVYQAALAAGLPVVPGEYVTAGYHYYPDIPQVRAWLDAAGFDVVEETVDKVYQHFIVRRR